MKKTISFMIPENIYEKVNDNADKLKINKSDIYRAAIYYGLENSIEKKFDISYIASGLKKKAVIILNQQKLNKLKKIAELYSLSVSNLISVYTYFFLTKTEKLVKLYKETIIARNDNNTKVLINIKPIKNKYPLLYDKLLNYLCKENIFYTNFYTDFYKADNLSREKEYVIINSFVVSDLIRYVLWNFEIIDCL